MTTIENALLQQMQKLAASMSGVPGAANKDKGVQAAVSFQEMMQQSGGSAQKSGKTDTAEKPLKDQQQDEGPEEGKFPVQDKSEEELKPEELTANPNAVNLMDMFRPEIVEQEAAPEETVVTAIPEETVEAPGMNLEDQTPDLEAQVDTGAGSEISMEQQPRDFSRSMEEAPKEEAAGQQPVQARKEAAPEENVEQVSEHSEMPEEIEIKVENHVEGESAREAAGNKETDGEETGGEVMAQEQPVFHDTQAVPVKVGERYETVDTQKPEMERQLATTINDAVQAGAERVEIRLAPQNLGSLVIEMVKNADGVLQVVLHASNPRAEGLLSQHLNGLHSALQGYGHEEVRLEVQRNQEGQEQHFKHADPDGRGQHQGRQQRERREETPSDSREFLQKLRLGLFGSDEV